MSASVIMLALAVGTVPSPSQATGAPATVLVRGFVPASCRVSPGVAVGCNIGIVKQTKPGGSGNPTIVLVSAVI